MPFIRFYDHLDDRLLQFEISDETAAKAVAANCEVSPTPFDGVKIESRYRSQWSKESA
jgi:hypothetical protein